MKKSGVLLHNGLVIENIIYHLVKIDENYYVIINFLESFASEILRSWHSLVIAAGLYI